MGFYLTSSGKDYSCNRHSTHYGRVSQSGPGGLVCLGLFLDAQRLPIPVGKSVQVFPVEDVPSPIRHHLRAR